jgi:phage/plasmid-associated DNA primase
MNNKIFNQSEYLRDAIEEENHDNLALLWIDITKSNIKCVDCEGYIFYQFDTTTLLYKRIKINAFTEVVKQELKAYLKEVMKMNTDSRLKKLVTNIGNKCRSSDISKVIAVKIFDDKFLEKLDNNIDVINFKNGYVNLKSGEFQPRTTNDLYSIALNLNYDSNKNEKIINDIKKDLIRNCNDDEEFLEFMLAWLGYCLTGHTGEQKSLWATGHLASNGKSTLCKIFCNAFEEYCYKFTSKSLNDGYSKLHKEMAECKGKRYTYIEELDQKKLDTSIYKDLVDGDAVNNEILFGTTEKIDIHFKLNVFSNHDPNFKADRGVVRRGILVNHTNIFYDEDDPEYEENKNEKGVYLKNKMFVDKYKNDEYKKALFHLLLPYAKQWYITTLKIPKKFRNSFKNLCDENDKMKDFIESKLSITGDTNDRIHKEEFRMLFNMHTKLNFSWIHILSDIKRTKLIYDSEKKTMYEGLSQKGCIMGVKVRNQDVEELEYELNQLENPLDADKDVNNIVKEELDYKALFEKLQQENDELQNKNKKLKRKLKKLNIEE